MTIVQGIISIVGIVGTAIAIYQWAVLNESKKRRRELQFLLAGIHQLALAKQLEWDTQIRLLPRPEDQRDLEFFRLYARARDNLGSIASAVTALESVIDTDSSAIAAMLKKSIEQAELNNKLQQEGLKNPSLAQPASQELDNNDGSG